MAISEPYLDDVSTFRRERFARSISSATGQHGSGRAGSGGISGKFSAWLGARYVFGAASGRSAFQLALEALGLEKGKEIIFPAFTFPVMPIGRKVAGLQAVFCDVDPVTSIPGRSRSSP